MSPEQEQAKYLWEQTSEILPGFPYARQSSDVKPIAIVFSQDDLHPEEGVSYLHACKSPEEARVRLACRNSRVNDLYNAAKLAIRGGLVHEAKDIASCTKYSCFSLCESESDIVVFLSYLKKIGAEAGGLSDSDFFESHGRFVIAWTPDWSSIVSLFPE